MQFPPVTVVFSFLLLLLADVLFGSPNECYSCMSSIYKDLFDGSGISRYFFEPRNFTDACDEPLNGAVGNLIGTVPCQTICLTLSQDLVLMGRNTGKKLTMRGCSSWLNRYGVVNRTLALFDRANLCRMIKVSELFRYESSSQPVLVCSCLGHRCNAAAASGVAQRLSLSSLFVSLFVYLRDVLTIKS